MDIATIVSSALLALLSAASGIPKILGTAQMREEADHLGISRIGYVAIGSLEVAAAAGLLVGLAVAPLGIAAATGMVLMMAGAAAIHARAGDSPRAMVPAFAVGGAGVLTLALLLVDALAVP